MKHLAAELVTLESHSTDHAYTVYAVLKSPTAPGLDKYIIMASVIGMNRGPHEECAAYEHAVGRVETLRAWLREMGVAE